MPVSGGKIEISDRIGYFLDTDKVMPDSTEKRNAAKIVDITEDTQIEENFVCSERHRVFFKEHIGSFYHLAVNSAYKIQR